MRKRTSFRVVAGLTVAFFVQTCITPYTALAFHFEYWYAGGMFLGFNSLFGAFGNMDRPQGPANCGAKKGDPVSLANGQENYVCTDMVIPGRGMDVVINHNYRNGKSFNNQFGYGWSINYYSRVKPLATGEAVVIDGETNRYAVFTFNGTSFVAPPGYFEELVQNIDGTWTLTKADGKKYHYDLNGNLSSIVDRNGNQMSFTYDPAGAIPVSGIQIYNQQPTVASIIGYDYRLTQITDTLGRHINFSYDATGRLTTITDFNGRTVTFTYDNSLNTNYGNLLTITKSSTPQFPAGLTKTFTYDTNHNLLTITDPKGQTFVQNHYDALNRVVQQDLGSGSFYFTYNVGMTAVTDPVGNGAYYYLTAAGNPSNIETFTRGFRSGEPASFITEHTYNNDMMLTSTTYPQGNGVKYVYDENNASQRAHGNLLQVRRKADMAQADNDTNDIVVNLTYESQYNQVKTITDAKGNVTTFTYDYELPPSDPRYGIKGNLVNVTYPTVNSQTPTVNLTYNTFGQVTEVQDPTGLTTQYSYDALARLSAIHKDPAGVNATTQISYDTYSNIDTVTDPNNRTTNYDFNALGWLIQVTNPLNYVTKYTYDANANVTQVERQANAGGTQWQTAQFTYDILNNMTTVTDPLNRVTTYTYDNNGNVTSVVDANNNTTTYQYDERDLLFQVTDANSPAGVTQYDYDLNGKLATIYDAKGNPTNYTYDGFDRLITKTYADTSTAQYAYDKNSNLTNVTPASTEQVQYVYDALNRMTEKNFPSHTTLNTAYGYDVGSHLLTANNAASQISYTYDVLNNVQTVTQQLGSLSPLILTYGYDSAGNRTQVIYPSGKTVDYVYDANDRLQQVRVGGTALTNYTYDTLDRRTQKDLVGAVTQRASYSLDLANQLSNVTNSIVGGGTISQYGYTFDNVGNRLTMNANGSTHNYSYNNIYELTGVSGAQTHSFAYDNVANRTTADAVNYTSNGVNQYTQVGGVTPTYDANGNLTSDGSRTLTYDEENRLKTAQYSGNSSSYTYDGFNRRVSKTVNSTTTYFLQDGDDVVAEYTSAGALAAEYVHGSRIDEVLTMDRGGTRYYYHYDGLGSVTQVTNGAGSVAESYTYDVYGQPSVTSSLIGNPYRFTGREFDEESGLYHYRARAYSPTLGRFLQRDPIGYWDSMNLFQYAFNSPVNWVDPWGETTWLPDDIADLGRDLNDFIFIPDGDNILNLLGDIGGLYGLPKGPTKNFCKFLFKGAKKGAKNLTQRAKRSMAKQKGGIPKSAQPTNQQHGPEGSWWEYFDSNGKPKIVVEHPDGSVHVGTPKPQSQHHKGKAPKYYPETGTGHIGEE